MIIVDSNVLSARNLAGPLTPLAEQVERRDPVWIVPPLWRYEFQNVLTVAVWTRKLTPEAAGAAWRKVAAQLRENECEPDAERVLDLSVRHRITAYDAQFVALALQMGVPCVTEDAELQNKFPGLACSMAVFLAQGSSGKEVRESLAPYRARARKRKTTAV